MSNNPRNFEFQQKNSTRTNVELKGNLSKRALGPECQEFNQFRRINLHDTPNSKRTMIPELAVNKLFKKINLFLKKLLNGILTSFFYIKIFVQFWI